MVLLLHRRRSLQMRTKLHARQSSVRLCVFVCTLTGSDFTHCTGLHTHAHKRSAVKINDFFLCARACRTVRSRARSRVFAQSINGDGTVVVVVAGGGDEGLE